MWWRCYLFTSFVFLGRYRQRRSTHVGFSNDTWPSYSVYWYRRGINYIEDFIKEYFHISNMKLEFWNYDQLWTITCSKLQCTVKPICKDHYSTYINCFINTSSHWSKVIVSERRSPKTGDHIYKYYVIYLSSIADVLVYVLFMSLLTDTDCVQITDCWQWHVTLVFVYNIIYAVWINYHNAIVLWTRHLSC